MTQPTDSQPHIQNGLYILAYDVRSETLRGLERLHRQGWGEVEVEVTEDSGGWKGCVDDRSRIILEMVFSIFW